MADHIIHASLLLDGRVRVHPLENPLEVVPGDTVEWRFVDAQGQGIPEAEIEFLSFLPRDRTAPILNPGNDSFGNPLGGQRQKAGPRSSVADTDRGLYLYAIFRNGQPLDWEVPLFSVGSFSPFFGGIIIRDPPGGP